MNYKTILVCLLFALAISACASDTGGQRVEQPPKNLTDSMSYSLGYTLGKNIIKQFIDDSVSMNVDMVLLGIEKSITEDPTNPYMLSSVIDSLTRQLESHAMEKQQQKMMEQQNKFEERSKTAAEDGKKFFAENKNKPGIVSDKAGFQYRIITKGEGALPTEEQMIKFHFIAKFIDGEEIQSTYKSTPIEMPLMYGSPVMIELIKKMPVGSKWEIFWPAKLPYGPDGISGLVPPEALIIWELELLEVQAMGTSPAQ